jgi:hypothetical protein
MKELFIRVESLYIEEISLSLCSLLCIYFARVVKVNRQPVGVYGALSDWENNTEILLQPIMQRPHLFP